MSEDYEPVTCPDCGAKWEYVDVAEYSAAVDALWSHACQITRLSTINLFLP